ncbi:1-acyl-sn-glycerol-3-phosphate acyltransferase [Rhodobacteraceae bacterium RKSG542]|uniref:lysophospholipid acyltransferase family protein n=1 Tax=Pseudovibrio flavus TaxID=2529854 RepID=UPI0012BD8019|nr:lysophospholipid acyltransferase family protein [Pseudovibrio flavus]MTI18425.1 1-acyl-sn-glycerol-3-phosphate acyltransferase [Pseudovibrio flavus]
MIYARSLLFNFLFYLTTFVLMIVASPVFLLPRRWGVWVLPVWSHIEVFLLRWVAGVRSEVTGWENIPKGGCIIASKHQSAWETFALLPGLHDPTFILKRELRYVPIFGWYTAKFRQIPVDRGKRTLALAAMTEKAREAIAEDRNIIIFPEGTRRPAGAEPKYKFGIAHLYKNLDCPVIPVAINSGVYWPRRRFFRFPGTIKAEILPAIEPGLPMEVFMEQLQVRIENASNRLLDEAAKETPDNIIIKEARQRQRANAVARSRQPAES